MELFLGNKKILSVFQLLGENENHISFSVAWGLNQCPAFLGELLLNVIGWQAKVDEVKIDLQKHELEKGFTDIELILEDKFHLIIEAKKGWNLPDIDQLENIQTACYFPMLVINVW